MLIESMNRYQTDMVLITESNMKWIAPNKDKVSQYFNELGRNK